VLSRLEAAARSAGRAAASHPSLRRPLLEGWGRYVWLRGHLRARLAEARHASHTRIPPFRVAWVDPADVELMVERSWLPRQARERDVFPLSKFDYAGRVMGGEWDRTERRFDETALFRGFQAHFRHGVPWEETAFYATVVGHIERGTPMWGCESRAAFWERCEWLDGLYATIRDEGYRPQSSLDGEAPPLVRLVNDEIAVCVARDGRLLFKDGRNRLAMAKLLGLEAVPVWLMVRHAGWQAFRETVAATPWLRGELSPRLREHPDL